MTIYNAIAEFCSALDCEAQQSMYYAHPSKSAIHDWHNGQCAAKREVSERLQRLLAEWDEVEPITSY